MERKICYNDKREEQRPYLPVFGVEKLSEDRSKYDSATPRPFIYYIYVQ